MKNNVHIIIEYIKKCCILYKWAVIRIGIENGLKIRRFDTIAGSSPAPPTHKGL